MKRLFVAGAVLAVLCLPATAWANWTEDFDSYAPGSQIVGQGGWEEWGAGAGALVSNLYSQSPTNSVEAVGATDLVHPYSGYTSGQWIYTAYQYIPSGFTGLTYFIMLNTYNTGGPYDWSVQVGFDQATGMVVADCGSSNPVTGIPYVVDAWAEIKVMIDLDRDWCQVFYNGQILDDPLLPDDPVLGGGYQWTGGVFGGGSGALNIGAVDLFANGATAVYYDDMSLLPDPTVLDIKCNGGDAGVTVPSGTNAKLTFVLNAQGHTVPIDVWVVMNTPFGFFSYDKMGPFTGWNMGLNNAFYTGAAMTMEGVALDRVLPAGSYKAFVGIDVIANGQLDLGSIVVQDMVDFTVQ